MNTLGLWIAAGLLSDSISYNDKFGVIVMAGLVLSIVNTVLRPFLIILALPAIVFSLGLFMIVVNGFMLFLVTKFYDGLQIDNFGAAILAGMVIGLVNYLVTTIVEDYQK
jgi:putative membrane protein